MRKIDDARTTPDDLPDLPSADVVGMVSGKLPTNATAMRRGFAKPDNQFTGFEDFPDSGQPPNWPNGFER
jgi:hypothetical protein